MIKKTALFNHVSPLSDYASFHSNAWNLACTGYIRRTEWEKVHELFRTLCVSHVCGVFVQD